jgi:hypothetical protein
MEESSFSFFSQYNLGLQLWYRIFRLIYKYFEGNFKKRMLLIGHRWIFLCCNNWMRRLILLCIIIQSRLLINLAKFGCCWIMATQLIRSDLYNLSIYCICWFLPSLVFNYLMYICPFENSGILETYRSRFKTSSINLPKNFSFHFLFFRILNFLFGENPTCFCVKGDP